MRTLFFVQPYDVWRHKLRASGAQTYDDADTALDAGKRLASARRGVVVLRQTIDASRLNLRKPEVLAIYGRVPEEWEKVERAA